MNTKDQLTQHTNQIARLEQVMTALAEAQVRSEDDTREMKRAITALAKAQAKTQATIEDLTRQ